MTQAQASTRQAASEKQMNIDIVGNPGAGLELPWGLVSIGMALVPVSRIWRGPVAIALGGLQYQYQ